MLRRRLRLTLLWLSLTLALAPVAVLAQSPGPQQAGLVVVGEEGVVTTTCVTFTEPALTGLSLLERAGVALTVRSGGGGTAICGIDALGCPSADCFCRCKTAPCRYWSYFHRDADGAWRYSARGADSWPIAAGDVDAWVWGDGTVAPPALALEELCAVATPTTATLAATAQPASATPPLPATSAAPVEMPLETPPASPTGNFSDYGLFALLLLALLGTILIRRARRR